MAHPAIPHAQQLTNLIRTDRLKVGVCGRLRFMQSHVSAFVSADGLLSIPDQRFRALALFDGQEITSTCVPLGSGAPVATTQ